MHSQERTRTFSILALKLCELKDRAEFLAGRDADQFLLEELLELYLKLSTGQNVHHHSNA